MTYLLEESGIIDPWTESDPLPSVDPAEFRHTLSHFPSGVVVITGMDDDGTPVGLTCQSFTSLSLDPPLILIAPSKSSRSWPRIAGSHRFAVNILGDRQRELSARFARSSTDKFAGTAWHVGEGGSPLLDDAIAVIECDIDAVHHGGDHWIVSGAVRTVVVSDSAEPPRPLVFYRSAYRALDSDDAR